jgi:hypothetical protein
MECEESSSPVPPLEWALEVTGRDKEETFIQQERAKYPRRIATPGILQGSAIDSTGRASIHVDVCSGTTTSQDLKTFQGTLLHLSSHQLPRSVLYLSFSFPDLLPCSPREVYRVPGNTKSCLALGTDGSEYEVVLLSS